MTRDPGPMQRLATNYKVPIKRLWSIDLRENFVVVVNDGEDPLKTFLTHFPDHLILEDLPGYDDADLDDYWEGDTTEDEVFDRLILNAVVKEQTEPYRLDSECAEALGAVLDERKHSWFDGFEMSPEEICSNSKHGDMWSERWAD